MSISYVSDSTGATIAVQIPVEDWMKMKEKHPDLDDLSGELPLWQKQLIDDRLSSLRSDPQYLKPGDELLGELDKEV